MKKKVENIQELKGKLSREMETLRNNFKILDEKHNRNEESHLVSSVYWKWWERSQWAKGYVKRTSQTEKQETMNEKKDYTQELWGTYKQCNIWVTGISEKQRRN